MNTTGTIRAYHQRTKHQPGAYARGPEYLDWENQPDPVGGIAALDQAGIAKLPGLSMGLSAWKVYGSKRSGRTGRRGCPAVCIGQSLQTPMG